MNKDIVIAGAGPAGLTAALYASRAGLDTAIVEAGAPGGKTLKTHLVSNYPGVPEVPGPDLGMSMYEQALSFGAEYVPGEVKSVSKDLLVTLEDGQTIQAKSVIVATGTKERLMNIPGEQALLGRGVSFCAVCDGAFFRDKTVVVIGGGNSALEESLFLCRFVKKLYIVIRRDVFRAEAKIQSEILNNDKIEVIRNHIPVEVLGDESVSGIVLEDVKTHEKQTVDCQGIFPYIGQDPISSMVDGLGVTDEKGYIQVDENMMTKVPGLFAAGDVIEKELRQIVNACGEGAVAAQAAWQFISNQ
jgi:thioredoxin reductase (NADPH)